MLRQASLQKTKACLHFHATSQHDVCTQSLTIVAQQPCQIWQCNASKFRVFSWNAIT